MPSKSAQAVHGGDDHVDVNTNNWPVKVCRRRKDEGKNEEFAIMPEYKKMENEKGGEKKKKKKSLTPDKPEPQH